MRTDAPSRSLFQVTKAAAKDFSKDDCGLRAASLSYYTVFALPPLLILLIKLAGLMWDPQQVQDALESQFAGVVGSGGASTVASMVSNGQHAAHGVITTILSIGGLILGATGAFLSLQTALNAVWEVGPDPKHGGIKSLIVKRILSFGMVLGLAFLLIVSLAVSAALSALGKVIGDAGIIMQIINIVISIAILAVLFGAIFKFLPDATIPWRSVWVGGIATTVLFEIGKFVIGLYLGHSNPGNAFGAASALAVILVWLYYAGMLVLFGAEFTRHYAKSRGHAVQPKKGADRIERAQHVGGEASPDSEEASGKEKPRAAASDRHDAERPSHHEFMNEDRRLPVPVGPSAGDGRHAEASARASLIVVGALLVKRMINAFRSRS